MKQNSSKFVNNDLTEHKKLYKSKKLWITASLFSGLLVTNATVSTAHADTNSNSASNAGDTQANAPSSVAAFASAKQVATPTNTLSGYGATATNNANMQSTYNQQQAVATSAASNNANVTSNSAAVASTASTTSSLNVAKSSVANNASQTTTQAEQQRLTRLYGASFVAKQQPAGTDPQIPDDQQYHKITVPDNYDKNNSKLPAYAVETDQPGAQGADVSHDQLDQAVKRAQDAGVYVTKNDDVNRTLASITVGKALISKSYQDQITALNDAYEQQLKNNDAYNKAKADYDSKLKQMQDQINQDSANRSDTPNYNGGKEAGYTAPESWQNLAARNLDSNGYSLKIAGIGNVTSFEDLKNPNNYHAVVYNNNQDKIITAGQEITNVVWDNVDPQVISGNVTPGKGVPTTYTFKNYTKMYTVDSGAVIRIPGAIHTADGKTHDLIAKYTSGGDHLKSSRIIIWNQDGALNYLTVGDGHTHNQNIIYAQYWVDNMDNTTPYLWLSSENDIDAGQTLTFYNDDGQTGLLSVGGGLHMNQGDRSVSVKAADSMGASWGKNFDQNSGLTGSASVPDGTVVYAHLGTTFRKSLGDYGSPMAYSVADADFGINLGANEIPTPPLKYHEQGYYHYESFSVNPRIIGKTAHNEGKGLYSGDQSTQYISQDTGYNSSQLKDFYIADDIIKNDDGSLPVTYNLSDWTVNNREGQNVTNQGQFEEQDLTRDGYNVHEIRWVPLDASKLNQNDTYTLVTKVTDNHTAKGGQSLDFGYTPYGKTVIRVYNEVTPDPIKHWIDNNNVVDNKTYMAGDTVHGNITLQIPDPSTLVDGISQVGIVDNYSAFKDKVTYLGTKVMENGHDATSSYDISVDATSGLITARRKNISGLAGGSITLLPDFKINSDTSNGTTLSNTGSAFVNNAQVNANTVVLHVYKQNTDKHWTVGSQIVDGKTFINDSTVSANVTMSLPDKNTLAKPLDHVAITDNYADFADKVTYIGATVLENGIDTTSQYTITNSGSSVTAVRNDPSSTPSGYVVLVPTWRINHNVPSGTKLFNTGSGTINQSTVGTPERQIVTYIPITDKHWMQGQQVVDGKTFINDDQVVAQVTMTLPDPTQLAQSLNRVQLIDNYSQYQDKVDYIGYQVLENGIDVTSEYKEGRFNGQFVVQRINPAAAPQGTVTLRITFKLHDNLPTGTKLINSGSGTIDSTTVPTPDRTILTYRQDTDKHWVVGNQVVDNKTFINNDQMVARISMTLPQPTDLAHTLNYVALNDNFSEFQNLVDVQKAWVTENGVDVSNQYTISVKDGHVIAVRNTPASTPAGEAELFVQFKIHDNVPSNTKLVNSGSGTIDSSEVPTPTTTVITYEPTSDKHWVENDKQIVDDKTYVDGDTVHGQVKMSLPNPSDLAKPLTHVEIVDNYSRFANYVIYKSARVFENGMDVTSQYTITDENNEIKAVRNNPATTPGGEVWLLPDFEIKDNVPSGTALINSGYGRLNDKTVVTPERNIYTFKQEATKHWTENDQIVDNKVYIADDTVHASVTMTLPDPSKLAVPLNNVSISDNYSRYKQYVDYKDARVYENGQDVTDQYNIVNDSETGIITATRKDAATTPNGQALLRPEFLLHDDIPNWTKLVNSGSGQINHSVVNTPDATITVYKNSDTDKHWTYNSQVVDNKVAINDDTIDADVTMNIPDVSSLAKDLQNVQLADDYSQYANKVQVKQISVFENGQNVTDQYDITNTNGQIIATRKDPAHAIPGLAKLHVTFQLNHDTPSGSKFVNTGFGVLNNSKVETKDRTITTYTPNTDKHFVEGQQVVDDKTYINDDQITGQVTMTLPQPSDLTHALTHVEITDDYSQYANYVDYIGARVLENGRDVTSLYTINIDTKAHIVHAIRKDPATTPAGNVALQAMFKVHHDVPSGTKLVNSGSGTLNNDTVPTPKRTVITYTPVTDKHWREGDQIVDGRIIVNTDKVDAAVSMTLPDPSTLATPLRNVQLVDNYSCYTQYVDLLGWNIYENGKDVTDQYTVLNDSITHQVFATRKNASTTPGGVAEIVLHFKLHANIPNGTQLINSGEGTINSDTVPTPNRIITTYMQEVKKDWMAGDQVVNNKMFINGDKLTARVTQTLPDPSTLANKLFHVSITDDFTAFSQYVDYLSSQVLENGQDVTSQYKIEVVNGHIIATRIDPSTTPDGIMELRPTFMLHKDVPTGTKLINNSFGTLDEQDVPSPSVTITTFKNDQVDKNWTENGQQVNSKLFVAGDNVDADVTMVLPDKNKLAQPLNYVELEDNYGLFEQYAKVVKIQVLENGVDMTDYYTITDDHKGLITAVRKRPDNAPSGLVDLHVSFIVNEDVPNGTKLINSGAGTINTDRKPTKKPDIVIFKQDADKHWVDNGQIVDGRTYVVGHQVNAEVSTTLPDHEQLGKPLTNVVIDDNFTQFAKYVDYVGATVFENGQDVTGEYKIEVKNGHIIAARIHPDQTPSGTAILHSIFKVHDDVPNGTDLINTGSSIINTSKVNTPNRIIVTYRPQPKKNWVEGQQVVNNKTYINGDEVHGQVSMQLPDPADLVGKLSEISLTDDYSQFSKDVDFLNATVTENGVDVTDKYIFTNINGHITATRSDASTAPGGLVVLQANFKLHSDIPNGTKLINGGSGSVDHVSVPVPKQNIITFTPSPEKHWLLGTQTVDNKVVMNGDTVIGSVTMVLPDKDKLATPLKNVSLVDDYTAFPKYVVYEGAKVFENGEDVTDLYRITNNNGIVTATRINTDNVPSGAVNLQVRFGIKEDLPSGTKLINLGKGILNYDVVTTPKVVITNWQPKANKDVKAGEMKNKDGASINHSGTVKGEMLTFPLMADPIPANSADHFDSLAYTDTLADGLLYKGYRAYLNNEDITSHIHLTQNGQELKFDFDDYLLNLANNGKGMTMPTIDVYATPIKDATKFVNQFNLVINGKITKSNKVDVYTPAVNPNKHNYDAEGIMIDGKDQLPGTIDYYKLMWNLGTYKGTTLTDAELAKGLFYVDDFPEDALEPNLDKITFTDSNGHVVNGISKHLYHSINELPADAKAALENTNIHPNGDFILFTVDDVKSFKANYIDKGLNIQIMMPATVKQAFAGSYQNVAYEIDFGNGYQTNIVSNNVEKMDPTKDVVLNVNSNESLNGKDVKIGQIFDYKLNSSIRPANYGGDTSEWSFTDIISNHDQVTGQTLVKTDYKITLLDGTVLKPGSDITKYFTISVAPNADGTTRVTFTAKDEFLKILNMAVNKQTQQGFSAFIQAKRIKTGDATNEFTESYNHMTMQSNKVVTHTPEEPKQPTPNPQPKPTPKPQPKTPKVPITPTVEPKVPTPTPQPSVSEAKPIAKPAPKQPVITPTPVITSAPKKQAPKLLPQTGNADDNSLVLLGLLGLTGVMMLGKRRKED